jgi:Family of unknown function (DUF6152)
MLAAAPLWAHHSTTAVFDMTKHFTWTGTMTKVDWINPHVMVSVDAKGDDGKVESWVFETNPPAWFRRVGISKADFSKSAGKAVTIGGVRAKDGSRYGYLMKITFADGTSLESIPPDKK